MVSLANISNIWQGVLILRTKTDTLKRGSDATLGHRHHLPVESVLCALTAKHSPWVSVHPGLHFLDIAPGCLYLFPFGIESAHQLVVDLIAPTLLWGSWMCIVYRCEFFHLLQTVELTSVVTGDGLEYAPR